MNKRLNEASRLRGVPSVGTELMLPDSMPSLFPETTCTEAIGIAEELIEHGALDKRGIHLLWHMGGKDDEHLPECPCLAADELRLAADLRRFFQFAE